MNLKGLMNRRNVTFLLFSVPAMLAAGGPIKELYDSSHLREYYSHIALIPLISGYFVYQRRREIFSKPEYSLRTGLPVLLTGLFLYFGVRSFGGQLNPNDMTSIIALSAVVWVNGAFMLCYGAPAHTIACFPFLFLFFAVPIPTQMMNGFIYLLQVGSTEITNLLLMATGLPFLREDFVFHLTGMSIEVAKECSGIRSSLALLITALLAGQMFLKEGWKRAILIIAILPITMLKNGIRILVLTLLGTYVDPKWLTESSLHRDGGILFFILALLMLAPLVYGLRTGDGKPRGESPLPKRTGH